MTSDFNIQMPVGPRNKSKGYAFIRLNQSDAMVALARSLWGKTMPTRASPTPLKIQPAEKVDIHEPRSTQRGETRETSEPNSMLSEFQFQ